MRRVVVLLLLLVAGPASAQPVTFQIKQDVPAGQKPLLRVAAAQDLSKLTLELKRNDGKKFRQTRGSLRKGKTTVFKIGDGAAGKATYTGTLAGLAGGKPWTQRLSFETLVRGKLSVVYDREHLHLDRCVLEFKVSRPAASAELVVYGEDGKEMGRGSASYSGKAANTWLPIKWKQQSKARVMKMRLRVVADNGLASTIELIPWSVTIDHEDVTFASGSAVITPSEQSKLDASVARINEVVARSSRFMKMTLYIAGHTDTVGRKQANKKLSAARARAIAGYFRSKGVAIQIAFAGFGELVPAMATADETDNASNRRVDYVIGPARGTPPFSGRYLKVGARWQTVR